MSLNVSYNQIASGIDTAALKEVTKQIFQRSNTQNASVLDNADLTKFNRVSLGTDLYKANAATARQIATVNAGLDINLSEKAVQSLKYLNSQASKSVFSAVEGKIALPETQTSESKQNLVKLPSFGRLIETLDLSTDKKGSNPFFYAQTSEAKNDEDLNIVA